MRRAGLLVWLACACAEPVREELPHGKPVAGTVPRERAVELERQLPVLTTQLLRRGQQRYTIDCAVCHGSLGDSDTPTAHAFTEHKPTSLHDERVRGLTDEALFDVIGRGTGAMLAFPELTTEEKWAVVGYVRALQLSQRMPAEVAPADAGAEP